MAQVQINIAKAVVTPAAFVTPAATEDVAAPGTGVAAWIKVGATPATVTVVRHGNEPAGDAKADYTTGAITNGERIIPLGREFIDPTDGNAVVQFSSTATVTWAIIRAATS